MRGVWTCITVMSLIILPASPAVIGFKPEETGTMNEEEQRGGQRGRDGRLQTSKYLSIQSFYQISVNMEEEVERGRTGWYLWTCTTAVYDKKLP